MPTFLNMVALVNGDCRERPQTASKPPSPGPQGDRETASKSPSLQGDRKGRPYIYSGLPEADNIFHMLQRCCCNWAHIVGSLFEDGIQRWQIAH